MTNLTSDNSHYQGSQNTLTSANASYLQLIAQDFHETLAGDVRTFAAQSVSKNTRRAYAADLRKFDSWGGSFPSRPEMVAIYLAAHAGTHKAATLRRWAASLSRAHIAAGFLDPTKIEPAASTLKGICRSLGVAPNEARPLLRDELFAALDATGNSIRDKRDRALLLIGFSGGFRRSELVGLDIADVEVVRRGILIMIRRCKTDQTGIGRQIAIPDGRTRHCPVIALESWLDAARITAGPLFRPVTRQGYCVSKRLSGEAVASIVKGRVAAIGIDPKNFSGHSLRAGFATSAAQAGVSSWKIRQQTGHASDAMLARYIRSVELFEGNAAGALI